ncbi:MAG: XdhC/CoxI family protein [Syntrophomonadaceae bacterium]
MRYLIKDIIGLLKQKESFALATVVRQQGSAPREAGARMLIRRDGSTLGTIGGGALEAAVGEAGRVLIEQGRARLLCFNLNDLGMFCGGQVEVRVDFIDAQQKLNLEVYEALLDSMKTGRRVWMLGFLGDCESGGGGPCMIDDRGVVYGKEPVQDPALWEEVLRIDRFAFLDNRNLVVEPLVSATSAFIFGAGHIAQRLVPLLNMVGFFTAVIDEREEYANRERFADADSILVSDYNDASKQLVIGEQSYIVIITHSHDHDREALAGALKTRAAYIGMIASQTKRERVFRSLLDQGFSPEDLKRVHSPIGLNIGAETPEEIAISISAEMIKIRAQRLSKGMNGY